MSVLAVLPNTSAVVAAARPLVGLGVFATLLLVFKPMIAGLLQAALLVVKPRQSLERRRERNRLRGILLLNHMADDLSQTQPNLATELRLLASRG